MMKMIFTIGKFDGVHRGHQFLLKKIRQRAYISNGQVGVLAFSNHPQSILQPNTPIPNICTPDHKILLLKNAGADFVQTTPFTHEIANLSAEQFLHKIHSSTPFTHLVLGYDQYMGKNREGTPQKIREIGQKHHFSVEYLEKYSPNEEEISSSAIRTAIQQGQWEKISSHLGRDYSIYAPVIKGAGKGRRIGVPTLNLSVSGLVLPPFGVYTATVVIDGHKIPAVSNLGFAPTLHHQRSAQLESHLLLPSFPSQQGNIEVIFHRFLRSEKSFSSNIQLQQQIRVDLEKAKEYFGFSAEKPRNLHS